MSSNLYTSQRLTSGNKPVISLVNGLCYAGGPTPAVVKEYDFAIINTSFSALAWSFDVHVNGSFTAGFAGPGWGTGTFDNELNIGVGSDRTLSLGGGGPYSEAGFLIGAELKFAIHVKISGWKGVRWVGGWHGHFENIWGTITDTTSQATLDLISLVLAGIEFLVNRGQGGPLAEVTKRLKPATGVPHAGWGLIESTTSALKAISDGRSTTDIIPQLTVKIDLSQFVPPIREFNLALSKVGSSVQFGPTFGIGFPIHIQVEGVIVDNAVFGITSTRSANAKTYYTSSQNNLIAGSASGSLGQAGYRPGKVGFRYKWAWGLDITVGVYAKISIFYVINISTEFHFGLLQLLGINTNVQSDIRGDLTNNSFAYQGLVAQDTPQPVEFVFD